MQQKGNNRWLVLCLSVPLLVGTLANAGNESHGGDPLRNLYLSAQLEAAIDVEKITSCSFGQSVPAEVRKWILKNQAAFVFDIQNTKHNWIIDTQGVCAFTGITPMADITFSYNECRVSTHDIEDAKFTLLHESVHHFGVTDESFADNVARAVLNQSGTQGSQCAAKPEEVFKPDYCAGNSMTIDDAALYIGSNGLNGVLSYRNQWTARSRNCQMVNSQNVCSKWFYDAENSIDYPISYTSQGQPISDFVSTVNFAPGGEYNPYVGVVTSLNQAGTPQEPPIWANFDLASQKMKPSATPFGTIKAYVNGDGLLSSRAVATEMKVTKECMWVKARSTLQKVPHRSREVEIVIYGSH